MRDVMKTVIILLTLSFVLAAGPAFAFMPSERGAGVPQTVWSASGIQGTVSGRVVTSLDQAKGAEGAYVALVDAVNTGREYYNTTTDADGNYRFTGVNATFSSTLNKGPDGTGGTYQRGMNAYMIYANYSAVEGYSSTFGIDTNHTGKVVDPIVIYAGIPSEVATPEPTAEPTAVAETPVPATPTPAPTPAPASLPTGLLLIAGALIILVIAAITAYFLFLRKK
jgi:hypothetical protein